MVNELTFIIIKSDAIERGLVGTILNYFERVQLNVVKIENREKNREWFKQHYGHVEGVLKPHQFKRMELFMLDRTIGIILYGRDAIKRVRKIVGATHCFDACPGTIRGDWGCWNDYRNLIHAADSPEAVKREVALYFDSNTDRE